ncbi:protein FAR1-RELATED SEQUENCE 5-like [Bidens hawaiensis]|uniref:protein FAR1-RELATED SEQUENCE 5-like n=1 Tax=Bidens hawaiensis TaxID=980011 RepID=UPI00404AA59A
MEYFTSIFDDYYPESNFGENCGVTSGENCGVNDGEKCEVTSEENSEVGVGENSSKISVFSTDKIFVSLDELKKWAEKTGRENGVVIVIERTKKNAKGEVNKIFLMCDRGGVYKSTAKVKRSGTIKTTCPFQLVGKYHDEYGGWMLRVSRDAHNHEQAQHMEGHSYAMRLTGEQKITVRDMYRNKSAPCNILAYIQDKDETNVSSLRTVYNEMRHVRAEIFQGESHMEVLFRHLDDKGYTHDFRKNPSTNAMEDLFFMHPTSYIMFRSFPHVLIIDTTYNTNVYRLPLVQIVGVTSTGKTITIALSFIPKEKEDNFRWVLTRLKKMLHECMMPRVILTDRDLALINACNVVFPDAAKFLCRWHISQNIKKYCKQSFTKGNNWEFFEELLSSVVFSPTPAAYEYNYKRLHDGLTGKHKSNISFSRLYCYLH